ncbi:isoeugenol monooxygenase [Coniochaeta sp. 2T2.1]|nr:isoeugenol monooxygenase [Coniochaeta sp. 2T2.1]
MTTATASAAALGAEPLRTVLLPKDKDADGDDDNHWGLKTPWDHYYSPINTAPQGRFECEMDDMVVFGEIPKAISGTWYRVIIDPHFLPQPGTPFTEGDGNICAFRIQDSKVSMKIKYVQTERWLLERKAGQRLFGRYRNPYDNHPCVRLANDATGNTNIIYWGGQLLALAERGLPHALDPDTLETLGADPYAGQTVAKTFSAHPKADPFMNELVCWSYQAKGLGTSDICTFTVDPDGRVDNENWFKDQTAGWPHDGWITENWIVLSVMPFEVNSEEVMKAGGDHWSFIPDRPAEFLVAPRKASSPRHPGWKPGEFRKYTWNHGLVIHVGNAWEAEDGTLQLESHFISFNVFPMWNPKHYQPPKPAGDWYRWTIDLSQPDGSRLPEPLKLIDGVFDFPQVDDRFLTRKTSIAFIGGFAEAWESERPVFNKIIKFNTDTREKTVFRVPSDGSVAEPAFIPRSDDAPEGDGWLIFYTERTSSPRGQLLILDTKDFSKPVAIVEMPFMTRNQVHGNWVPNPHPGQALPPLTAPIKDVTPTPKYSQLTKID